MRTKKLMIGCAFAITLAMGGYFFLRPTPAGAADETISVPAIIQDGFQLWAKKGTSAYSFDVWKKGGLLENDNKPGTLANFFSRIDQTVGGYKSFDVVDGKSISASSKVIYVAINFDRAAVYGRFLVYRTDKGWVVQNMDFSFKPEALMPWLAFSGDAATQ